MRDVMMATAISIYLVLVAPAHALEHARQISWDALIDVAAQNFEDPYRDLSLEQLDDLVMIVQLRARLDGVSDAEKRAEIEAHIAARLAILTEVGIDVDWLIDQRWVVAERRKAAALAGNATLDDTTVELGGFLIPAPPAKDGTPTAYLVPERGMCSHMPPPPPNQLLQLRVPKGYEAPFLYTPVVVRGTIELVETARSVFVVDGPVPMWSAWTMQTETLKPLAMRAPPSDLPLAHQQRQ